MEQTDLPIRKFEESGSSFTRQRLNRLLTTTLYTTLSTFKKYSNVAQEIISLASESVEIALALMPNEEIAFRIALDAALNVDRIATIKERNRDNYQKKSPGNTKILLTKPQFYQKMIWEEAAQWQKYQETAYLLKYLEQCEQDLREEIFNIFKINIHSLKKDLDASELQIDKAKSQLTNQLETVVLNEQILSIRYLQTIFLNSIEHNAGHVAFVVGHLIHGYSLAHTAEICAFTGNNTDTNLYMLKKRTLEKLKKRFRLFIVYKDPEAIEFETVGDINTVALVKQWRRKFIPWQVECPLNKKHNNTRLFQETIFDWLESISGDDNREIHCSHIFICPDCFEKLISDYFVKGRSINEAKAIPPAGLAIPKFQLPRTGREDMTKTHKQNKGSAEKHKEHLSVALKDEALRFSKACQAIENLLIFVDGELISEIALDNTSQICISVNSDDLIKVMTKDEEGLVLLATFLCTKEHSTTSSKSTQICASAALENGYSIVFNADLQDNQNASENISIVISYELTAKASSSVKSYSWLDYLYHWIQNIFTTPKLLGALVVITLLLCIIGIWYFSFNPTINHRDQIIKDEKPFLQQKQNNNIPTPQKQEDNIPQNVKKDSPNNIKLLPENAPVKQTIEISDGRVKVTKEGKLILNELTTIDRTSVEMLINNALVQQPLKMSDELLALRDSTGVNMGSSSDKENIRPISPVATYIQNKQPVFTWQPFNGATYYDIHVYQSNKEVFNDRVTKTSWQSPISLDPEIEYSWQVIPHNGDGISIVPLEEQLPEPRFVILAHNKFTELTKLKKSYATSHLLLGYLYLKYNLREDAEKEFLKLYQSNPHSKIAKYLIENTKTIITHQ